MLSIAQGPLSGLLALLPGTFADLSGTGCIMVLDVSWHPSPPFWIQGSDTVGTISNALENYRFAASFKQAGD